MSYNPQAPSLYVYNGNPNGYVAGVSGSPGGKPPSLCQDSSTGALYVCTQSGVASSAVWTLVQEGQFANANGASGQIFNAANGTTGNEVVTYQQVESTNPVGAFNTTSSATSLAVTTATFTAPSKGRAIVRGDATVGTTTGASLALTASASGLVSVVASNGTVNALSAFAVSYLPMTAGQTSTFTATLGTGAATSLTVGVAVTFEPSP